MRKRIIVVSPSSSTAPVVTNGSCRDHELPASGTPTIGSDAVVPALVVKTPSTVRSGSSEKLGRLAKTRPVGLSRPTQIGPVVTVPPAGMSTELSSPVPCTYEDSLPETILAPPVNVRPEAASNDPPGGRV